MSNNNGNCELPVVLKASIFNNIEFLDNGSIYYDCKLCEEKKNDFANLNAKRNRKEIQTRWFISNKSFSCNVWKHLQVCQIAKIN